MLRFDFVKLFRFVVYFLPSVSLSLSLSPSLFWLFHSTQRHRHLSLFSICARAICRHRCSPTLFYTDSHRHHRRAQYTFLLLLLLLLSLRLLRLLLLFIFILLHSSTDYVTFITHAQCAFLPCPRSPSPQRPIDTYYYIYFISFVKLIARIQLIVKIYQTPTTTTIIIAAVAAAAIATTTSGMIGMK